jgi:hypothetical protein
MQHNRLTDLLQDIDDLIDSKCLLSVLIYKNRVNFTTFQNYENPSARGHISIYSTVSHWSVELAQMRNFIHVKLLEIVFLLTIAVQSATDNYFGEAHAHDL